MVVGMVAVNLIFFLGAGLPTSRAEMASHDARLAAEYRAIRQRFPPGSTRCSATRTGDWSSAGRRRSTCRSTRSGTSAASTAAAGGRAATAASWTLDNLVLPPWVETLVFIHDHRRHATDPAEAAEVDPSLIHRDPLSHGTFLCWMPVLRGDRDLIYGPRWRGPRPGSSTPPRSDG